MDVRKIRLRNFKCFQNVEIDCAKITLLTGANSSGKSSLLDSLLGAVQSARFPLFYSPNGDYVIVWKKETADNGDIVVAMIEERI